MQTKATGIAGVAGTILLITAALAADGPAATIEACGALVPPGKSYSFSISGRIDTHDGSARLSGDLSVSDPGLPDQGEMPEEARPFVDCLGSLIR